MWVMVVFLGRNKRKPPTNGFMFCFRLIPWVCLHGVRWFARRAVVCTVCGGLYGVRWFARRAVVCTVCGGCILQVSRRFGRPRLRLVAPPPEEPDASGVSGPLSTAAVGAGLAGTTSDPAAALVASISRDFMIFNFIGSFGVEESAAADPVPASPAAWAVIIADDAAATAAAFGVLFVSKLRSLCPASEAGLSGGLWCPGPGAVVGSGIILVIRGACTAAPDALPAEAAAMAAAKLSTGGFLL